MGDFNPYLCAALYFFLTLFLKGGQWNGSSACQLQALHGPLERIPVKSVETSSRCLLKASFAKTKDLHPPTELTNLSRSAATSGKDAQASDTIPNDTLGFGEDKADLRAAATGAQVKASITFKLLTTSLLEISALAVTSPPAGRVSVLVSSDGKSFYPWSMLKLAKGTLSGGRTCWKATGRRLRQAEAEHEQLSINAVRIEFHGTNSSFPPDNKSVVVTDVAFWGHAVPKRVSNSTHRMRNPYAGKPTAAHSANVTEGYISHHGEESRRVRVRRSPFNYYIFALQWPGTVCRIFRTCRDARRESGRLFAKNEWTIHGLWPAYWRNHRRSSLPHRPAAPSDFDKTFDFDFSTSSEGVSLRRPWPSFRRVSDSGRRDFQRDEWVKHGVDSGLSVLDYFEKAKWLFDQDRYNVYKRLKRKGIVPDSRRSKFYTIRNFGRAIQEDWDSPRYSYKVEIVCFAQMVKEIYFCLDDNFEQISCPKGWRRSNCPPDLYYLELEV